MICETNNYYDISKNIIEKASWTPKNMIQSFKSLTKTKDLKGEGSWF